MEEGQTVRLIQPVIEGPIIDTRYNKDIKGLEHLVQYTIDGEVHERWFVEKQLESVPGDAQ